MTRSLRRIVMFGCLLLGLVGLAMNDAPTPPQVDAPDGAATPAQADAESQPPDASEAPTVAPAPANALGPAFATGGNVAIIRIDGMIYDFTLESMRRRVDRARDEGASIIVFELNTPGGVALSAIDIAQYIKGLSGVTTIAWINTQAYSAGILIASACDHIVMAPVSVTGDCAPIVPGQNLSPTERAKALSPLLEEFRDNARNNGYDYVLFHAMCELSVKVYYVEHIETGQRRLVNQLDYEIMVNGRDPQNISGWARALGWGRTVDEMIVSREVSTDDDLRMWKPVTVLPSGQNLPNGLFHDGRTLLTLSRPRAEDIGLARGVARDDQELGQFLGAASVVRVPQSWSENLAGWLTHPAVRAVLVIALLLGAYIEFQTPGIGVAGAVALVALIALLGAPFLVGLAEVWHIIVFFIGFLLLMGELFVTPGFGVMGIAGSILMFIGLVLSVVPTSGSGFGGALPPPEMMSRLQLSAASLLVGFLAGGIGLFIVAHYFGSIPLLNRMVLFDAQKPAMAGPGQNDEPTPDAGVSGDEALGEGRLKVGDVGRVTAELRPTGRARFDDQIVDVTTHGMWVDHGRRIRVSEIHGNVIVVEPDDA